jgi:glycosyltransferase involved in cell wall biosynthesis
MTLPLISVIIPVYNSEKHLAGTMTSLLNQTYQNLQVIVVDDGSTDKSGEILTDFAGQDGRVSVYQDASGAAGLARNFGLKQATGDYLMFLDSDDVISLYTIERLYEALKGATTGFAMSKYTTERQQLNEVVSQDVVVTPVNGSLLTKLKAIQGSGYPSFSPWGKLYTRDIFDGLAFPTYKIHEDTAVILPIVDRAVDVFLVDSVDWYYRIEPTSLTNSKITEKNFAIFEKNKLQMAYVADMDAETRAYIDQLCLNENDFVAMKCVQDGSELANTLLDQLFVQNQEISKRIKSRQFLYQSKVIYRTYLKVSSALFQNDVIRGIAKKLLT